ncbi:MAG: hypothetical protein NWE89_14535 [Candidatus Bathyarchaeota archaeon]|nr:hypothetical protein [Candidatus Bathyarchaeota archaeon]
MTSTQGLLARIQDTLTKNKFIYIGYVFSLATFIVSCFLEYFETPFILNVIQFQYFEQIIFATMVFSVFMLVHFVRVQERLNYEMKIQEQTKIKEGVWLAEQEIRNQIILINQATHVAERKGVLDGNMISVIRENTQKMEQHLKLLQTDDVDPRRIKGRFTPEKWNKDPYSS